MGHLRIIGRGLLGTDAFNLPIAVAKRKVRVTGPVTKLLGLIPALQPAYAKYRSHLAEIGRQDLVQCAS